MELERAKELYELAVSYKEKGEYDKALKVAEESAEIRKKISGVENSDYANSILEIGKTYLYTGNYKKAEPFILEAKEIYEKTAGNGHKDYANSLTILGKTYLFMGNFEKAKNCLSESKNIFEDKLRTDDTDYAECLNQFGLLCLYSGDYKKAEEHLITARNIYEKVFNNQNYKYGEIENALGMLYTTIGEFNKALSCLLVAKEIVKKEKGIYCFDYASVTNTVAVIYYYIGDYSNAEQNFLAGIDVYEKVVGKEHSEYSKALSGIANLYRIVGNYKKAEQYYLEVKNIREKILGKENTYYATALNNLSVFYSEIGDYKKAEKYALESNELYKKILGEEHIDYALSLAALANIYEAMEKYKDAEKYLLEAKNIYEKRTGKEHPNYLSILNNIGGVYENLGYNTQAETCYKEVLDTRAKILGKEHPDYALSLNNLGFLYIRIKEYKKAEKYLTEAKDILGKNFGKQHSSYIKAEQNLASLYAELKKYALAESLLSEAVKNSILSVNENFTFLSESQREAYWSTIQGSFLLHNILAQHYPQPSVISQAYNNILFTKGLLLRATNDIRDAIYNSSNQELITNYNLLGKLRNEISEKEQNADTKKSDLDVLYAKADNLEKDITVKSQAYKDAKADMNIQWQSVENKLSKSDVAIEFIDFNPNFSEYFPYERIYAALVLKRGWEHPKMVKLFRKGELDSLALQKDSKIFADADMETDQNLIYESTALGDLIWSPLEDYLKDVQNIYFAPSGILHQLAVEYLPTSKGNVQERFNLYRLSSTRQLAVKKQDNEQNKTVLYGDLDYGSKSANNWLASASDSENFAEITMRKVVGELSMENIGITPLKYTKEEIENINGLLSKKGMESVIFSGMAGTETSFKSLSGQKIKRLHIATHGFYLPQEEQSESSKEDMSLYRSGLFMAENTKSPTDDGILTAKEIAQTDLRGLDLVVLSACQTGLGEVTGEGVFGLQRGFKKAGAQTLLMSLWSVSDEATAFMMSHFYEHLLSGKSKREAFMSAQNDLRNYELNGQKTFDKPQFWAAFILLDA
jgi:CHAT domain-containing protein/Flp pilus assembly protein TadD